MVGSRVRLALLLTLALVAVAEVPSAHAEEAAGTSSSGGNAATSSTSSGPPTDPCRPTCVTG